MSLLVLPDGLIIHAYKYYETDHNSLLTATLTSAGARQGGVPSARGGNVALLVNNERTGSFFLVSDKELKAWLEDPGYNSAVRGLFWDIIYVDADVSINLNCSNGIHLEDGIAEVSYEYNLELKKGFNWVEYSIEDIHVTDPEIMASFPLKVRISNLSDQEKMKWMAEYFF
jgi:hypothetical protein